MSNIFSSQDNIKIFNLSPEKLIDWVLFFSLILSKWENIKYSFYGIYPTVRPEEESLAESLFPFFLYSGPCAIPGGHDLWRVRLITMKPARIQGDITDIDSIIEINGRRIVTTVETQWFITGQMRGTTTAVSVVVESEEYPGNGTSWDRARYPGPLAKRVNGRGSDLLSFGPRIVTNLRDRVTVRLTTMRRRNAAS